MVLTKVSQGVKNIVKYDADVKRTSVQVFETYSDEEDGIHQLLMREQLYIDGILVQDKIWVIRETTRLSVAAPNGVEIPYINRPLLELPQDAAAFRVLGTISIYRKDTGILLHVMNYDMEGILRSSSSYGESGEYLGETIYTFSDGVLSNSTSFYKDGTIYRLNQYGEGSKLVSYQLYEYPSDTALLPNKASVYDVEDDGTETLITYAEFEFSPRNDGFTVIDRIHAFTANLRDNRDAIDFVPEKGIINQLVDLHTTWWALNWTAVASSFKLSWDEGSRLVRVKTFSADGVIMSDVEGWDVPTADTWESPSEWYLEPDVQDMVRNIALDNNHPDYHKALGIWYTRVIEDEGDNQFSDIMAENPPLDTYLNDVRLDAMTRDTFTGAAYYGHDLSYIHPKFTKVYDNLGRIEIDTELDKAGSIVKQTKYEWYDGSGNYRVTELNTLGLSVEAQIYDNKKIITGIVYNILDNQYVQIDIYDNEAKQHVGYTGFIYDAEGSLVKTIVLVKNLLTTDEFYGESEYVVTVTENGTDTHYLYKKNTDTNTFQILTITYPDKTVFFDFDKNRIDYIERGTGIGSKKTVYTYNTSGVATKAVTSQLTSAGYEPQFEEYFDSTGRITKIVNLVTGESETRDYYSG